MVPIDTSGLWGSTPGRPLSRQAEATYTPTVASVRHEVQGILPLPLPPMTSVVPVVPDMQALIAEALKQGIAAGLQSKAQGAPASHPQTEMWSSVASALAEAIPPSDQDSSAQLDSEEGEIRDGVTLEFVPGLPLLLTPVCMAGEPIRVLMRLRGNGWH